MVKNRAIEVCVMYVPKHFAVNDADECLALMQAHPLATVVQHAEAGLQANHIPLLVERKNDAWLIRGHVARANAMWQAANSDVLLVFQGADAYISPNWYASKAVDHKAVPTWNYAAVHVSGRLVVHEDEAWLRTLLTDLTAEHEQQMPTPWGLNDAPEAYIVANLRALVGIEIEVKQVVGKWKVSQNHPQANRETVCQALRQAGGEQQVQMADWVEQFAPKS
jgi:transcriptional regulator